MTSKKGDMSFFVLGSCRVYRSLSCYTATLPLSHIQCHYGEEIRQNLRVLCGEMEVPAERANKCFRHAHELQWNGVQEAFSQADVVFLELCSIKRIEVDGLYYNILEATVEERKKYQKVSTVDEMKNTLREIIALLHTLNKHVVLVSHIVHPQMPNYSKLKNRVTIEQIFIELREEFPSCKWIIPSEVLQQKGCDLSKCLERHNDGTMDVNHFSDHFLGIMRQVLAEAASSFSSSS